ncbi:MAG: peptidase M14 family protein, partial [Vicinamibacteria bacterium]
GGMSYGAGSYVISLAQPKMGLVRNLLGRTLYPDNEWTRARDGSPLRPYDTATHTMAEIMGVRVDPVDEVVEGDFEKIATVAPTTGSVGSGSTFRLDGRSNASFEAVNVLLDRNVPGRRVDEAAGDLRPGDFLVDSGNAALSGVARETGVQFEGVERAPSRGTHEVKRGRTGMYQRYRGGNMDEGWTRFVLEQFRFPYQSVMDAEIRQGNLRAKYDVILLPHDSAAMIEGKEEELRQPGQPEDLYPPEYRSGIGDEGVAALKDFVEKGGTLVTLGEAAEFAIENFDLKVRNVLEKLDSKEFFCPGSTLKTRFENDRPLAYGMPSSGLVLFWESPAFEIAPSNDNDDYEIVATYADRDILQSGWLVGEKHLSKKAAMVAAQYGQGKVVLIGFRPQHRAQTHGTFQLLFNTLIR